MTKMREYEMVYRDSGTVMPPRQSTGWDVAGQVAERMGNLALNIYRTQTAQDAMRFSQTVDSQFHDAYLRNAGNADGFLTEVDSIGSGLLESMSGVLNRKDFKAILEQKKQQYMMAIAENSVSQQVSMTEDQQAAFLGDSLTQLAIHASSAVSSDASVRDFGVQGARKWAEQVAGVFDVRDPRTGKYLIPEYERARYVDDINKRWQRDCLYARVRNTCSSVDDIRQLKQELKDGRVELPIFSFAEEDGRLSASVGGSVKVMPTDELMGILNAAERDMRRARVDRRTSALWASGSESERIYGICQSQVDEYYQSARDSFEGQDQEQRVARKSEFIRRTGTLPTAVWSAITHAVAGDPNSVAVASEWLQCADEVDPAIAHNLCDGNDALEVAIHRVAGTQSAILSSDNALRNKALDRIANGGDPNVSESVALSAIELYPDSPFSQMLMEASAAEEGILMGDFVAQAQSYSSVEGADTQSVLHSLRGYMHGVKPSTLNTIGEHTYMAHPPEDYLLAQDDYGLPTRDQKVVLERFGKAEFGELVRDGVLPEGAKYLGVYLYETDATVEGARRLGSLSSEGLNYMIGEGEDGQTYEVYSPYYGAMVRYRDETGIVRDFPIRDFNPSLEMQMFARRGGK